MCNKAVDDYPHALEFVRECCKTQKMCDKTVNTYPSTIKVVSECYKTQKMCDKAVNRCFFVFDSIPDQYNPSLIVCCPDKYKTQRIFDRVPYEDNFLIVYCPDKYITQKMCDKAVDDSIAALKLIPDWFVTNKMIKKLFTALDADENILYFNEGSNDVLFNCSGMGILNIDLNNINLDNNFDEDDPDTIIM